MTIYKHGDLMLANEDIIGHQTNCRGIMGSGVAACIRTTFPKAYAAYSLLCKSPKLPGDLLGMCQLVLVETFPRMVYVANIFGQDNCILGQGMNTNYEALRKGLQHLADFAREHGKTVALPKKIGCALGGGDWEVVRAMIEEIFEGLPCVLYSLDPLDDFENLWNRTHGVGF